ncbi:hypothetical protein FSARC_5009 [Fusarium sarcochroum]|uniref:Uncharacterized protein n=1 Tax=Fusarium sarcochroum TaxID=1208366 RepID=A0A8H4U0D4_9HYPO|nr:hypothetical protein FSARC_5009 [Fusarium sarcochroum]
MARRVKFARKARALIPRHLEYKDHAGRPYTLVSAGGTGPHTTIAKLSIQLYCLGRPKFTPQEIGLSLLNSDAVQGWGNACNYWPRVDVHTGFGSVEECVEHHRREKAFRRRAVQQMRQDAVAGLSEEDAMEKLNTEVQGKEPLPHIVPSWCESARFCEDKWWENRYRSWIFVIPEDRFSWEDIIEKGLLQVQFDLDVSPGMLTEEEEEFEESTLGKHGWVLVYRSGVDKYEPVEIIQLCAREESNKEQYDQDPVEKTPGCHTTLRQAWINATGQLRDCTYRIEFCESCIENEPHEWCETERDEHYFDDDGQCIACRRVEEYRRRSRRVAAQGPRKKYTA